MLGPVSVRTTATFPCPLSLPHETHAPPFLHLSKFYPYFTFGHASLLWALSLLNSQRTHLASGCGFLHFQQPGLSTWIVKPWRKGTVQCGKWQVLKNTACLLRTNLIIDWIGMQFRQASGLQSVLATATPQGRGRDGIQGKPESPKGHLTRQIRYMFKWKRK